MLEPETNSIILANKPILKSKVISEESSKLVRYALESVVANGSGRNAYIENYRVGGKTGTAQKVKDGKYMSGNYIVSFMGFMPADDPELIVYVAIDHPLGITQYGGTVSAPIAKNIFESAIPIFNFKESKDGMEKEYRWLDEKYVVLPDCLNKSLEEAKKILKGFKVEYSGTGDKVIYQSPAKGSYIKEGGSVKLLLG